jgi:septal ring-binding cell division protein DamX
MAVISLMCLFGSNGYSVAQTENDSEATAENEIICYAAKNKWVCAPADQKQQAHDKAMKLVEQNKSSGIDQDNIDNSQVEIKTMDVNNDFSQQVQQSPAETVSQQALIDQQIKDFIPRQDVNDKKAAAANNQQRPADEVVETVTEEEVEVELPTTIEAVDAAQQPLNNNTNGFDYWQKNHAEKWSFQVIGTSNRHQLDEFLSRYDLLESDHTIVKTQANSADWWVVLVGLYDSREQALSLRNQLPPELASQAWVRQVKTIVGEAD